MKYRHLFFDLDHTLWDFDRNAEATLLALYHDYDLKQEGFDDFNAFYERYSYHNDRMWTRFRNGQMKRSELHWKRMSHTFLDFKVINMPLVHALSDRYTQQLPLQTLLTPGAKDMLDYCAGKYRMSLITNGHEAIQQSKLKHAGLAGYFEELYTSERCNSVKPQVEIFNYALQHSKNKCEECLMIGDALHIDVLGAANAGWDQVYYNPNLVPHQQQPTYEISKWSEMQSILAD